MKALVTGANRGIGFAIAEGLSKLDDITVLTAARLDEDAKTAAEKIGRGSIGVELDLSDPVQLEKRAAQIEKEFGPIDILVNNAAVMNRSSALDVNTESFSESINVNTLAPYALIHVLGMKMKQRGWGRIVNVTSDWGSFDRGLQGPISYSVSKAALNAVTFVFARELSPHVKVNSCCPGWVRTRMGGDNAERSPEQGADTPIWLATLPDNGPTGGFFRDRQPMPW